jgi:hypothetical protein
MKRTNGRWGALGGGTAAALLGILLGCNTPYIPLPPPGTPTFDPVVTTDAAGAPRTAWQATGGPNAAMTDARVAVYNVTLGRGVIARAQGTGQTAGAYVTGLFDGNPNDRIEISYENKDGELSPTLCVLLQTGVAQPCP